MTGKPLLSIFPGIDLLGRAFEELGFCVVRGPDLLWGGAMHSFHIKPGWFDGLIGGPPCQFASNAREILDTSTAENLIPEYVRVFREGEFRWSVMENVSGVLNHPSVPRDWHPARLRDWDCGGETSRKRAFWTWPFMVMDPVPRAGDPSLSVLASTAKKGKSQYAADKRFLPGNLPIEEYERLQGAAGATRGLMEAGSSKYFAVHVLGNGVPLAMGRYIASAVRDAMYGGERAAA